MIKSEAKNSKDATPTQIWCPASEVVVLRDSHSPQTYMATTCEEYMMRSWPRSGRTVLEMLDRFIDEILHGKSTMHAEIQNRATGDTGTDWTIIPDGFNLAERIELFKTTASRLTTAKSSQIVQPKNRQSWKVEQSLTLRENGFDLMPKWVRIMPHVNSGDEGGDEDEDNDGGGLGDHKEKGKQKANWFQQPSLGARQTSAHTDEGDKLHFPDSLKREDQTAKDLTILSDGQRNYIEFSDFNIIFCFRSLNDARDALDFVEAWDWLRKTVRLPTGSGSLVSSAYYDVEKRVGGKLGDFLHISSNLVWSGSSGGDYSCWNALFQSCTLLECSLNPRPAFAKGLELSFDLMIALAASEYPVMMDGGVVFIGYRTVLFPTAIYDDNAQFHLLTTQMGQINPYVLDCEDMMPGRLLTGNVDQFMKMRCFLGWCSNAQINLGTSRLPTTIRYSGGSEKERSAQLDGFSMIAQVGSATPLSLALGLQSNFKFKSHRLHFTPSDSYVQLLRDTSQEVALIYDAVQRRGWLVPKLSLLLHMSRIYVHKCVDVPEDVLPQVRPHMALDYLTAYLETKGEAPVYGEGKDAFVLRQLLLGLNTNLLNAAALSLECSRKKLYGFEFLDIITRPGRGSCMKELKLDLAGKEWIEIANVVDALVVCGNLGNVITPWDRQAPYEPGKCCEIPCGFDYLTATIPCLERLVERRGGKLRGDVKAQLYQLSEHSFWALEDQLFYDCQYGCSGKCWQRPGTYQHLVSRWGKMKRTVFGQKTSEETISIRPYGAVVFGTEKVYRK